MADRKPLSAAPAKLRLLADLFDAKDAIAGNPDHEAQDDLRHWADLIEQLYSEPCDACGHPLTMHLLDHRCAFCAALKQRHDELGDVLADIGKAIVTSARLAVVALLRAEGVPLDYALTIADQVVNENTEVPEQTRVLVNEALSRAGWPRSGA